MTKHTQTILDKCAATNGVLSPSETTDLAIALVFAESKLTAINSELSTAIAAESMSFAHAYLRSLKRLVE